jgi:hypothetical protein
VALCIVSLTAAAGEQRIDLGIGVVAAIDAARRLLLAAKHALEPVFGVGAGGPAVV